MKELRILIKQLNQYPSNLFAIPTIRRDTRHKTPHVPVYGLTICNVKGEEIDFIRLGTNDGEVVLE